MKTPRSVVRLTTYGAAVALALLADPASAIDPLRGGQAIPSGGNGAIGNWNQPQANTIQSRPFGSNFPGYQSGDGRNWAPGTMMPPMAGYDRGMTGGSRVFPVGRDVPSSFGRDGQDDARLGNSTGDYHPSLNPTGEIAVREPNPNRWRLGVQTIDRDTGVQIVKVLPGSAAADKRMEPRDQIVAVNGYRVGNVHGVVYDLGKEFNLRADEDGLVKLLVQDNRTKDLFNIDVNLEPRLSQVSGAITWSSRSELPRLAYAEVQIQEIVYADAPPIVLAEQKIQNLRDNSAPFVLEFDPTEIVQTRRYVVAAHITDGHYTYFHHRQLMPVITNGAPRRVEVAMAPARDWTGTQQTTEADEFAAFERMFEKYMGRPLRPVEMSLYRSEIDRGAIDVQKAQVDIFSNPEFYNARCNADDRNFIVNVFRLKTGRDPSEQEVQYWMRKLEEAPNQRRPLTRELVGSLN